MAIEYTMSAKCDQCGALIEPATVVRKSEINSTRWEWLRKWAARGVMLGLPSLRGQPKLYCERCAGR